VIIEDEEDFGQFVRLHPGYVYEVFATLAELEAFAQGARLKAIPERYVKPPR